MKSTVLLAFASILLLTGLASAQGSNNCDSAQLITGSGPHHFVTGNATTDGPEEGVLMVPRLRQIENDVWFKWVAPSTAVYQINTVHPPETNGATAVAIYQFGCPEGPGRAIAGRMGNENGFELLANISFGAIAKTEYLIRIGNTVSQNRTKGIFTIEEMSPPEILATEVNPDNGRTYHMLAPSSWTIARVAALKLGGDLVTVNDKEENDWLMSTFYNFEGKNRSLWLGYSDAETEGEWVWANGETPDYENWSSANGPNNGNQYEHYAHIRKDHTNGSWNDLLGFPGLSFFYDEVHGIVEIGEVVPGKTRFLRGDCNNDGSADISDAVSNLDYQFVGSYQPPCVDACDYDDSNKVDVSDVIAGLSHLFLGTAAPSPPGLTCGEDPTDDEISCENFLLCEDN